MFDFSNDLKPTCVLSMMRRHLPLARDLVRLSRQQLVHRLDSYMSKRNLPVFQARAQP